MAAPGLGPVEGTYLPVVLVVDDDESHRILVQRWLERAGIQAEGYDDGASLLFALDRIIPDAILLDLHMEGIGGMTVLEWVRGRHPHVPVLMLTADAGVPKAVRAIQVGAYDYLTKPVDRTRLVAAVKAAIDHNVHSRTLRAAERGDGGSAYAGIIGVSPAMRRVYRQLDRVGPSDVTVLVTGESGTGKELVARAIHSNSNRRDRPFVAINCAAIPDTLQETELFGHEKGAFTGAAGRRSGRFEQADKGTLFLDEVGELSFGLQAKLLRVLQERRFYRVGGNEEIEVDVRIVCATNEDLHASVRKGRFREDLFYRLAVFELEIPPLRDRPEDTVLLGQHFLADFAARHDRPRARFSESAVAAIQKYSWPGNVREIQNAVERALVASLSDEVRLEDLPRRIRDAIQGMGTPIPAQTHQSDSRHGSQEPTFLAPRTPITRDESEKSLIEAAIQATSGNMSEVIRQLGIPRTTLYRKLKKYKIADS